MKVLFITRGFPTNSDPMLGNYESVQAKTVAKLGHQVIYIGLSRWRSIFHVFDKDRLTYRHVDGVDVFDVVCMAIVPPIFKIIPVRLRSYFNQCGKRFSLRKAYREIERKFGKPDVIHSHSLYASSVASTLKINYGIPIIHTEHWSALNRPIISVMYQKMGKYYRYADAILAVSQPLSNSLKRHFGIDSDVLYNMVENHFFDNMKCRDSDKNTLRLMSVGSLIQRKGFDLLINALHVCKSADKLHLDIIGEGPERQELQRMIAESGLSDVITLQGMKKPEEVSAMLCESDVFVLASRRETFGIVYIEAMAKGLPVIATICGGPEEFVNEKNGILIPVEDVRALADAIDYMCEHIDQYDTESIRTFCYDNFSQDVIARKLVGVYCKVIEKSKK